MDPDYRRWLEETVDQLRIKVAAIESILIAQGNTMETDPSKLQTILPPAPAPVVNDAPIVVQAV